MKKAYYIDTFSTDHLHEMYNASSLEMFCYMYDSIDYYARKDSICNVLTILGKKPTNVTIHYIPIIGHDGFFSKARRILKQFLAVIINVWCVCKANSNTDVIINYNTVISLYPLNWISRLTGRRVLIVCHGEMQDILEQRPVSFLFKQSIRFFKRNKTIIAKNLWFAVLGEGIRKNVLPLVSPQIKEKILSFDHTAIFVNPKLPTKRPLSKKLVLGFIGDFRESKGSNLFLKISRLFKDNPNVEFRIIGNIHGKINLVVDNGATVINGSECDNLSRKDMYNQIRDIDYAVYLFPPEGYKYTASGSIFDAIDCEKPIIALYNDFISNMFAVYGAFGYLEDNLESIVTRINWLISNFKSVEWNVNRVKNRISPSSAAREFSKSKWFDLEA